MDAPTTGTGGGDATPGSTVNDAASAFDLLLTPLEDKPGGDEAKPGKKAPAEAQAEDETDDPTEVDELTEESEEPAAESEENEQPTEIAADQPFTVRVDGKDEQVPLSELLAGYSRQSDYTRKTQSLANDKKSFEQEAAAARQERAEYASLLPKLRAALEAGMGPEPDWAKLKDEDPQKFAVSYAEWQMRSRNLDNAKAEEQRVAAKRAADFEVQQKQIVTQERSRLLEKIPTWKDPAVAKADSEAIVKTLMSAGYSGEELQILDHRAMVVARKSALYDAIMAKRPQLQKQQAAAKVVQPGGGSVKPKTATDQARNRFYKSGKVADAAGYFDAMLS